MIEDKLPPPTLYKYLPFNLEFLEGFLLSSKAWFSSPLNFNDPFDCFPAIDVRGSPAEQRNLMASVLRRQAPEVPRAERRRQLSQLRKFRFTEEEGRRSWREMIAKLGTFCLAEDASDFLMWGHYAHSHSGVCIGFQTSSGLFHQARKVRYGVERPVFRAFERRDQAKLDMVWESLTTKAAHWSYEREWRVFSTGKVGLIEFEPAAIEKVVLGAP